MREMHSASDPRVSVVVLTHNRPQELARTLRQLEQLPEQPPVIVVDNGSRTGTVAQVLAAHPRARLVRCEDNRGAAGRNAGVAQVRTPYVAFCDDDTWWAPGALARGADLLDAHPSIGALSARVLVGEAQRLDPTCEAMARSPLDSRGLPGPALISFMAGAAVMRAAAYREVGGYEPRLFLGAEEWRMRRRSSATTTPPRLHATLPHGASRRRATACGSRGCACRLPARGGKACGCSGKPPASVCCVPPCARRSPACHGHCAGAACCRRACTRCIGGCRRDCREP
jgi:hypothetical protein